MKASRTLVYLGAISGAAAVTGQLGDAPAIFTNPPYASYKADLGNTNPLGIKGSITASTDQGGGVIFNIAFSNLPTTGGPFLYHIHVDPVPADGNCTKTLAHLDPYIRGEDPPCDPTQPQTCQVGDLSGKHGKINGTSFVASYVDPYPVLIPGQGSFFGNRSFVLHYANKTRIACANFVSVGRLATNGTATSTSSALPGPTSSAAAAPVAPAVVAMPNAPSYAGGGAVFRNSSAPSTVNTNVLPNNGLTSSGSNTVTTNSQPLVVTTNAAGALASANGLAALMGVLAMGAAALL